MSTEITNKFLKKGKVREVNGSVIAPINSGLRLVVSVCSATGNFDSPFQKMLSKTWPQTRSEYKSWFASRQDLKSGNILSTVVNSDTWVTNLLCQDDQLKFDSSAMESCLKKLLKLAKEEKASVHLSTDLVSDFPALKTSIESDFPENGINVYVYTPKK